MTGIVFYSNTVVFQYQMAQMRWLSHDKRLLHMNNYMLRVYTWS